jgi:ubiquinone/menaquinone biosynthesis C-methylase UbiE
MSETAAPIAPAKNSPGDWSGVAGERWASNVDYYETMLHEVGLALLDHASLARGEKVVEIGCGGGALTRLIGAAVGPTGSALGLDISPALVALASTRAAAEPGDNVTFQSGDAQLAKPAAAPFDRLLSRFGVMFFADPKAAMINLHDMLKPLGRLDFAVWGPVQGNPWASAMMQIGQRHLNLPAPQAGGPGPFAFADVDYLRSLLDHAGFDSITFTTWAGNVQPGGPGVTAEAAADFALITGPIADLVQEGSEAVQATIRAELATFFRPYITQKGLSLPASVHFVTAIA